MMLSDEAIKSYIKYEKEYDKISKELKELKQKKTQELLSKYSEEDLKVIKIIREKSGPAMSPSILWVTLGAALMTPLMAKIIGGEKIVFNTAMLVSVSLVGTGLIVASILNMLGTYKLMKRINYFYEENKKRGDECDS